MHVTDVTTFLVGPPEETAKNLCFVRVDTDEGIHGWGECYTQQDRDKQITAHVDQQVSAESFFMHPPFDNVWERRTGVQHYSSPSRSPSVAIRTSNSQ